MIILSKQIGNLNVNSILTIMVGNLFVENNNMAKCPHGNIYASSSLEQAQLVENPNWANNLYSNTYNFGWRNYPNFSWANKEPLLEDFVTSYIQRNDIAIQKQAASIKNLGTQMG